MTPAEIEAFLDGQRTLVLVTLRSDGSPVAHALWFVRLDDALYVNTRRNSLKSRHIARDSRVCALVEAGESYFDLQGVRIEGRCGLVTDAQEIRRLQVAMAEKDRRLGSGLTELPEWFSGNRSERADRGDRVLFRIPMERVYSWDFSKVREHYARPVTDSAAGPPREGAEG